MGWTRTLRHFRAFLGIYTQEVLAYPARMLIWILTDAVTCFTMPLVMALVAGQGIVRGYSAGDFVMYYVVMLAVTSWVICHVMWEIMWEIREGAFNAQMLRPTSYLSFVIARNLAWRVSRLVLTIPIAALIILAYQGYLHNVHLHFGPEVIASLILGQFVSVTFATAFAMVALFVTDATNIFEIHYFPMLFLSGQIFPVAVLPVWAQKLSLFMPFYYTTALPTDLILGKRAPAEAWPLIVGQVVWIALSVIFFHVLYRAGTKVYNGAGA